ncbi:uncharacterized protein LOC111643663 [Copidosoma floridanum]|uniref:uncharacterized protein LOC111643663 n=1 Tax=Copidosoma floridanum TaxID=29053 RepID=UPI000C6F92D9|nr:uncharacterized protein LOC111643663 [Copidosoma floridanum]
MGASSKDRSSVTLPASCDELNKHFVGLGCSVPLTDARPFAQIPPDDRFYFVHVSPESVLRAINSAKSNAIGSDDVPVRYLKHCLLTILHVLTHIFDCSLQSCRFPEAWKLALVRAIPKRKLPTEMSHLRPISILSAA